MKNIINKAAKYESKKSLDGAMKFLKGNVTMPKQEKTPATRQMPSQNIGLYDMTKGAKSTGVANRKKVNSQRLAERH